jgi:hypothetical protein
VDCESQQLCDIQLNTHLHTSLVTTYGFSLPCSTVYQAVNNSLSANRPLRGALFWEWNTDGQPRGERAIEIGDTAWKCELQLSLLPHPACIVHEREHLPQPTALTPNVCCRLQDQHQ